MEEICKMPAAPHTAVKNVKIVSGISSCFQLQAGFDFGGVRTA
jgi:hypothetical protein